MFDPYIKLLRNGHIHEVHPRHHTNKMVNDVVTAYFTIVHIIFHFLWDHLARCVIFENGVLLMYMLEGVGSVANFIIAYEESQ